MPAESYKLPPPRHAFRAAVKSLNAQSITAHSNYFQSGDICYLLNDDSEKIPLLAGNFKSQEIKLQPLKRIKSLKTDCQIFNPGLGGILRMPLNLRGKVFNCLGEALLKDDDCSERLLNIDLHRPPPKPLERISISRIFHTGINSIDTFLTVGQGQRLGLFAEAGTGKSTLLGMLARNSQADVNVIALIGERGREVREFIEESLGEKGLIKSVVFCATSDETPSARKTAALSAIAVAEHYRAQGKKVLLLMDSLTRLARAIREISLTEGELPVRQGYTPSVFTELPEILERSGNDSRGSITAFFTILSNGEMESDPLADEIKSLLDGHIILSKSLATAGIRPAIDIVNSVSRCMHKLQSGSFLQQINNLRSAYARARKDSDLLLFGAIPDPELQKALKVQEQINQLITQNQDTGLSMKELKKRIAEIYSNK